MAILFNIRFIRRGFCLIYLHFLFLHAEERKSLIMIKRILFLLPLIALIACSPSKNGESLKPPYSDSDTSSEEPLDPALYGHPIVGVMLIGNNTAHKEYKNEKAIA